MRSRLLALACLSILAAPGCTRSPAPSPQAGAGRVTVRFVTGADGIPLPFGVEKGFFAEQGIDVKLVVIPGGGGVEAVTAAAAGEVKAESEGFGKVIARAKDYFGRYQHSYVFATQRFIDRQPDVLRRFLAGYRRTILYIKAHPEEAIQFAVRKLELEEAPLRHVTLPEIATWDPSGKVDLQGTDNAIRILRELGELDRSVSATAEQLVDQRFLAN